MTKKQSKPKIPKFEKFKSMASQKSKKSSIACAKQRNPKKSTFTPIPGTSGLNKNGGATNLEVAEDTDCESSNEHEDANCCVCGLWEPAKLREYAEVKLVGWAECDICGHWTHLEFCSSVICLSSGCEFRCPHCLSSDQ